MKTLTYTQLLNQTLDLYMMEHFTEAYEFITAHGPGISGNQAQIYNFRYSIAAKADLVGLAMDILEEAVSVKGFWYSYHYLTTDEDLIALRKNVRFKELAEICKEREAEARKNAAPVLKVIETESSGLQTDGNYSAGSSAGFFVALHGNQENAAIAEPYWSAVVSQGYTLALPQSSQIEFSDAYDWDDIEKGASELKNHMDTLLSKYPVSAEKIVIGSFSAGAGPALYAVLKGMINARALIFVAPWLPEIERWASMLEVLKEKNVHCHIICGDQDEDCLESSQAFAKLLKKRQIPYTLKLVEHLDHDFPESFEQDLLSLI